MVLNMNKIQAIILDLDGTLLDDEKKIGKRTESIIKQCKKNIKIVMASARQFYRIKPYLESLDLLDATNYTICFNGALVVNNKEEELFSSSMSEEGLLGIDDFILDNNDIEWTYYSYDNRVTRANIEDMKTFVKEHTIFKVVGLASPERIKALKSMLPQNVYGNVEVTNSEADRIEFVNKGMTKVKAIELVLSKLNINKENVVAIGDGDNDISMFEYVGCGIAMKNSPDIVKEKADVITEYTNNEDGVGQMIEALLQDQEK